MIALPIMGVGAADITVRSTDLTIEEQLTRELGAADALVTPGWSGGEPIYQAPDPREGGMAPVNIDDEPSGGEPPKAVDVPALLPAGATVVTNSEGYGRARTRHGILYTSLRELDTASPLTKGIVTRLRGEFPDAPDEVAATQHFLDESGLYVGSRVTLRGETNRTFRITGAYELPRELKNSELLGTPGHLLTDPAQSEGPAPERGYLVALPSGVSWDQVKQLNTKGLQVVSRSVLLNPPPDDQVPYYTTEQGGWSRQGAQDADAEVLVVAATVAGLAMLEICLLAGPAFAVGARRSRRQLGLVGANGGNRSHIRAIVLGGGLVLGVAAAVAGLVLAVALTLAFRPLLEGLVGQRFGGLQLRPAELGGIALLAVVTGLLAAIVPAVTASRQTVLASLTGRRGVRRTGRLLPTLGLAAVGLGAAVALYGATQTDSFLLVGFGSGVAELGVVALTPLLIGVFGRIGRWLPLSPRLAVRDAVRNRGRTAPAVAAVLAAVAGTVAVATFMSSDEQGQRDRYEARLPDGMVSVTAYADQGVDRDPVAAAVERTLPVDRRADFGVVLGKARGAEREQTEVQVIVPAANRCPLDDREGEALPPQERLRLAKEDWRCAGYGGDDYSYRPAELMVGDASLLEVFGLDSPEAKAALADGKAVAFGRRYVEDGRIRIGAWTEDVEGKDGPAEAGSVPAVIVESDAGARWLGAVVPPEVVRDAGLADRPLGAYFTTERPPTSKEKQAYEKEEADLGAEAELYVEQGFVPERGFVQLGLLGFAALVTIGAAGIATGLAQADAESDLRTLAAVGAAPRVRRTLSGLQCAAVAAMGVVLGSAAGVLPAVGLRLADERIGLKHYREMLASGNWTSKPHVPIVLPWDTLAVLLVAVPLGAGLLAALVTRSRTALARRAEA
ncbi:FtsX-like permease family protein [Streptomyces sp. NPDC051940]|uniref:FtsX-like permease family protein n=1 Tax=Streptomyces sp. NPDC051940 TaxID=3155675 RepID=UPI00341876E7